MVDRCTGDYATRADGGCQLGAGLAANGLAADQWTGASCSLAMATTSSEDIR